MRISRKAKAEIMAVSIISLTIASLSIVYGCFFGNLAYRSDVKKICEEVNYPYSEMVESYSTWEDINSDGEDDIVLNLKDGSRLEYLSKGHELNK